jgi:DNA-binding MarR family transcriptional regulator
MKNFDYQQIDEVIHSRIRLAALAVLVTVDEADFTYLREKVGATDGNLGMHLKKLEEAKYITVRKNFVDRKPITHYKLSALGKKAFKAYIDNLETLIKK